MRLCPSLHPGCGVQKRDARRLKPLTNTGRTWGHRAALGGKTKQKEEENKAGAPDKWRPREWFNILHIGLFSSFSPSTVTSAALLRSRCVKRRLAAHMSGLTVFLLSGAHSASARTILCLHLAHTARSLAAALHRVTQITISTGRSRLGRAERPSRDTRSRFWPLKYDSASVKLWFKYLQNASLGYNSRSPLYSN